MNTKEFEKEIRIHIEARYPILWLVSFEERRVERIVENLCESMGFQFWSWSVSRGLYGGEKKKREPMGREKILSAIEEKILKEEDVNNRFSWLHYQATQKRKALFCLLCVCKRRPSLLEFS